MKTKGQKLFWQVSEFILTKSQTADYVNFKNNWDGTFTINGNDWSVLIQANGTFTTVGTVEPEVAQFL